AWLRTCLEPDEWIKDSGCSKDMTGNKSLFSTYNAYDEGNVVFGSNLKGKIIGKGRISIDSLTISNVEHVDNLAFNLLSVGQKFDNKCRVLLMEKGVFLGYSQNSKAYVVLNKHTIKVKESLNVTFDESLPPTKLSPLVDDDVGEEEAIENNTKVVNYSNKEDESIKVEELVNIKESKNHPLEQVIEPKNVNEALGDKSLVIAMQEELNQFVANDVCDLVPLPMSQTVIGTKWVFRNKLDKNGIVYRNKARLVAQGYNQQDEDEIFFNQSKYIKEMLKKFGLEDSKPTRTPISTEIKLTKDDEADSLNSSKYR
nr:retrovirus-related Pol polyprotein from transposon TNT 1-94 [Tanacetum cinerariifolium]